jgi:hypothetical protein
MKKITCSKKSAILKKDFFCSFYKIYFLNEFPDIIEHHCLHGIQPSSVPANSSIPRQSFKTISPYFEAGVIVPVGLLV